MQYKNQIYVYKYTYYYIKYVNTSIIEYLKKKKDAADIYFNFYIPTDDTNKTEKSFKQLFVHIRKKKKLTQYYSIEVVPYISSETLIGKGILKHKLTIG